MPAYLVREEWAVEVDGVAWDRQHLDAVLRVQVQHAHLAQDGDAHGPEQWQFIYNKFIWNDLILLFSEVQLRRLELYRAAQDSDGAIFVLVPREKTIKL